MAKLCFGLTGAEIEGVLNDSVFESLKADGDGIITLEHIDKACMKMYTKGLAKGKHGQKEMYRVAVHEVGHALMNKHLGRTVVKVSIQPYSSGVGGVTVVDNETIGNLGVRSKNEYLGDLKVLYAGMVAEEIILGETSNGSSNDLEQQP